MILFPFITFYRDVCFSHYIGQRSDFKANSEIDRFIDENSFCLMPAFVDPHSHVVMNGQMSQFADLSGCESFSELVETMWCT